MLWQKMPEEYLEREKIYKPYMVGCHLENAPPEAIKAFEENKAWALNQGQ